MHPVATAATVAAEFASTPSGYVIATLVLILMGMVATIYRAGVKADERMEQRVTAQADTHAKAFQDVQVALSKSAQETQAALAKHSEALAILIAADTRDAPRLEDVIHRQSELDRGLAILTDRMDRHEQWANSEHNRMRSAAPSGA